MNEKTASPNKDAVPQTDAYMGLCNSLTYRFEGWRHLVENLISFFKQLESLSKSTSKEYLKLSKTITHPSKDVNIFDEHGVQDVFAALRDQTAAISTDNEQLSIQLPGAIIKVLELLRDDLKEHCKKINADGTKGVKGVEKQRSESQKLLVQLDRALLPWGSDNPASINVKNDPFIVDRLVLNSLARQVAEENNHVQSVAQIQELSFRFEQNTISKIKDIIRQFEVLMNQTFTKSINHVREVLQVSEAQTLTAEWSSYAKREPDFIKGSVTPRIYTELPYPGKNKPPTVPIIAGYLIRKTTIMKKKQRGFYAFTRSGYLYEFKSSDPQVDPEPEFALYIPDSLIGRPSDKKAKFKITGKDATNKVFGSRSDYSFRASNQVELMKWWEALNTYISGYHQPAFTQENMRPPAEAVSESDDDDDDFQPTAEARRNTVRNTPTAASRINSQETRPQTQSSDKVPSYNDSQADPPVNDFIFQSDLSGHNAWNV
ncbi:cytoskeletal signaling protein [Schizosaccharomyces octosporus yFS286]|uniref:Cytoskeletal signaling protein n=1 Tax=Schizosaccharomyces octosporus (strain yFS286) TaxID=483514 RepID=S9PVH9_SCHOY|nr:cytoskeletal signaling protein [Schizosaccharomyces octosporus yFS286]EPX73086.1 cytoskeletal signaling protein [Schizosaccharomyces octosporus yFS286]